MKPTLALIVLLSLVSAPAFGQADPNGPDPTKVKVRLGPVLLNPTLSIGNLGVDQNVFNDPVDPKRDYTVTISPRTEVYLRFLGTWFTGKLIEDIVWYQKYASERQGNNTYSIAWRVPFTRLTIDTKAQHVTTRERPGFEIDERAQRTQNEFSGTVAFRFLPSTAVQTSLTRSTIDFDAAAQFKSVNLHDQLNQETTAASIGINHRLTPLSNITLDVQRTQERYPFNPLRDADTNAGRMTLSFSPAALLKGEVSVAYTEFKPFSPTIPKYSGVTFGGNLVYTLLEVTRFTLRIDRGVQNSYDINQPYYVQTGGNLEIAQQVLPRLDIVARGGIESMAYRDRADVVINFAGRTDRTVTYGGGIGYHTKGRSLRLGLNYDVTRRESVDGSREYSRPGIGTSLTYDF